MVDDETRKMLDKVPVPAAKPVRVVVEREPSVRELRRELVLARKTYLAALAGREPQPGDYLGRPSADDQTAMKLHDLNENLERRTQVEIAKLAYDEVRDRLAARESGRAQVSMLRATWVMAFFTIVIAIATIVGVLKANP